MAIQLKRQGVENAVSCSDSPLKPEGLTYGEPAIDSSGYIYVGNGQGKVVSLTRFSDKSLSSSYSDNSLHSVDSDALSGRKIGTGIYNQTTEFIPYVKSDGGLDIGNYIDFHEFENSSVDYNLKLSCDEHSLKIIDQNKNYGDTYLGNIFIQKQEGIANINFQTNGPSAQWSIGINNDVFKFENKKTNQSILSFSDKEIYVKSYDVKQPFKIDTTNTQGPEIGFFVDGINKMAIGSGVGSGNPNSFGIWVNGIGTVFYTDDNGYCHANRMYNAVYNDYAELFPKGEDTEPGDIIALDINSDKEQYIKATSNSKKIVGVHSDEYGHLIGGEKPPDRVNFIEYNLKKYIPIGLVGRCKVKILGVVNKGDDIIASNIPGVGRAWKEGIDDISLLKNSIGFAVESSNNEDIKLIRVKLRG